MSTALVPAGPLRAGAPVRATGRLTVYASRKGRRVPLAGAAVWPYVPGTAVLWPHPLYGGAQAQEPLDLPWYAGPDGVVEVWADASGRLELEVQAPGYGARRVLLDVLDPEPPPVVAPLLERGPAAGAQVLAPPSGAEPAPPAPPAARAADFTRCFGQTTVFGLHRGASVPLAGAQVWAYAPGTSVPWAAPLYGDEAALTPLAFPVATDASGQLALWADAPARVELRYQAPGYQPERTLLDLEPPPSTVEGPEGAPGPRGSLWYSAGGAPGGLAGAIDKDHYLDTATGDVWVYEDAAGTPYGEGPYGQGPYGGSGA